MGRKIMKEEDKKIKRSISLSPDILITLEKKSINVSSLINKLLKNYIKENNY